jgi:carbonic anhydrase/acetyltransferase-like protein (isoleucine patch superfamily)
MTSTMPSARPAAFSLKEAALRNLRRNGLRSGATDAYRYLSARWQLRKADRLGSARVIGKVRLRTGGGHVSIGDRVLLEGTILPIELASWGAPLSIGDGTYINYGTNISARAGVSIGNNVAIGQYSIIMDDDYHSPLDHRKQGKRSPITIEDDAWLGARVIVLRGAHIGRGAVIGANSVVTGTIPPGCVAVGSPARVIKHLGEPE